MSAPKRDNRVVRAFRKLSFIGLARQSWQDINDTEILTRASAIAFTAMMATVPFLALVITIGAYLLPDQTGPGTTGFGEQVIAHLEDVLGTVFPPEASQVFEDQIARLQSQPQAAIISLSLGIMLWLASNLYVGIIDAINRIYQVQETRPYWKLRLLAAFMTVIQSCILLAAVVAIVGWPIFVTWAGFTAVQAWWATAITWLVVFLMVLVSFALIFHIGPDVPQRYRLVTPGSFFGTIVFILATYGFRLYIQHFAQYDAMYGSLGGIIILMFWFWICSLVLLMAAQMNKVVHYAKVQLKDGREPKASGNDSKESSDETSGIESGGSTATGNTAESGRNPDDASPGNCSGKSAEDLPTKNPQDDIEQGKKGRHEQGENPDHKPD